MRCIALLTLLVVFPLALIGQSIEREVDDFTDVVTIRPVSPLSMPIIDNGKLNATLNLYWYSDTGYTLLLTTSSDEWTFLRTVDRDNAIMYVIADDEKFSITDGDRVGSETGGGYVIEQYSWDPADDILQKIINAKILRMRLGTVEFPRVSWEIKDSWRAVYNAAKKEQG